MAQKVLVALFVLLFCLNLLVAKEEAPPQMKIVDPLESMDTRNQSRWVDSVFHSLTFEERLGQLFMVAAYSNKDERHKGELSRLIREENLGGLIFFQGGPVRQANLTNHFQSVAKTPLFIAMDAEWGVSMRLDSVLQFPKQMTLGAIQDSKLVYKMGKEVAAQFKALGMHINFAPVVDVNSNPDNPVIGYRAFGEEKKLVTRHALAYMKGLQDEGVLANAKHFPGHGDTNVDSHYATPVIHNSRDQILDIDLYPYRELINEGLMSVMVAHLHVPSLGSKSNMPTTLSKSVVTDLLRKDMNFNGLIFTDALNMKGVSNLYKPGEVDLDQILDIDLYPYRELINEGLMSVMVAHLHVPSLGSKSNMPTTLSKSVVTDLLRKDMNFNGLIFTDALNMKGVSNLYKPGEVDLLALLAGNDILLYSQDVPKAKKMILEAVDQGKISQEEIDRRVKKVLKAK